MELYRKLCRERPQKCRLIIIRHIGFKLRGAARHLHMYASSAGCKGSSRTSKRKFCGAGSTHSISNGNVKLRA